MGQKQVRREWHAKLQWICQQVVFVRPKPCPAIMEFTGYMHVPDKSAVSDKLSVNESKERRHYDEGRVQKSTILAER